MWLEAKSNGLCQNNLHSNLEMKEQNRAAEVWAGGGGREGHTGKRMMASPLPPPPGVTSRRCGLSKGVLGQERCRGEGGHWRCLWGPYHSVQGQPLHVSPPQRQWTYTSLVLPAQEPSALPPGQLSTDT